jgi:hypothetical protein
MNEAKLEAGGENRDEGEIRRIVIVGAGYGGLHVAQRLSARLDNRHPKSPFRWWTKILTIRS